MDKNLFAVVMAGGSGTRFWPLSRESVPKQFLNVCGDRSLLEESVGRLLPILPPERIIVIGNRRHKEKMEGLLETTGVRIICEPLSRNTAPCIGLAAAHIAKEDPEAIMLVLPSDHYIGDESRYRAILLKACDSVGDNGGIATIGVPPTRPETGYGYIRVGKADGNGILTVEEFVEKPDQQTAQEYMEDGGYFWNCGIFAMSVGTALQELCEYLEGFAASYGGLSGAITDPEDGEALTGIYGSLPSISFDYAVMEGTKEPISLVPADFPWSDVGSWQSLFGLRADKADRDGNVKVGEALTVDCKGCFLQSLSGRLVTAVGLRDALVVDTGDVLLVADITRSQEVKRIVAELMEQGLGELL